MADSHGAEVAEAKEPVFRTISFVKKNPRLSDGEFLESWEKFASGPMTSLTNAKSINYNQFYSFPEWREQFSILPKEVWLDCDGAIELVSKDAESISSLHLDPTYIDDIKLDHDNLVEVGATKCMCGYNRVKYERPVGQSTGAAGGEGKKPLVRLIFLLKKKPEDTFERADKYWDEQHGPLFASVPIVREKIIKYNQFYISSLGNEQLKITNVEQWKDYLGAAEFWAEDVKSLMDVWTHEDFMKIIVPDGKNFAHTSLIALIGYDSTNLWCGGA